MKKEGNVVAANNAAEPNFRKAAEAIAVTPKSGRLTLLTRKLFNVLLQNAQRQGISQETFSIPLGELCSTASFDSSDTALIKDHIKRMLTTLIDWSSGAKGSRRWEGCTLLTHAAIIEEGQRCTIEYAYSSKIKSQLLEARVYVPLSLQFLSAFRSTAALALYEVAARYVDAPVPQTVPRPWEAWRPILTGVPDGDGGVVPYKEYKFFKRDILKPSIREIGEIANIDVELIESKNGRKVGNIQFVFKNRPQGALDLGERNIVDMSLVTRMTALGLTQSIAERYYGEYEENKIRAALDYVEKRAKQAPELKSPPAYFRQTLQQGFAGDGPALGAPKAAPAHPEKAALRTPATGVNLMEGLQEAWGKRQREIAIAEFRKLDEDQRQSAIAELLKTLPAPLRAEWKKSGLRSNLVKKSLEKWLVRDIPKPGEIDLMKFGIENDLLGMTK